jgi:hypothetical protein
MKTIKALIVSCAAGGALWLASTSHALILRTQTFDTAETTAAGGWVGFNNNPIAGTGGAGGVFGFSNSNNTQGDPAGEAGGNFTRTDGLAAYFADVSWGRPFSVFDNLHAEGELFLQKGSPVADTQVVVGYIDTNRTGGPATQSISFLDHFVGFRINAANTIRANVFGGDYGGYDGSGGDAGAAKEATFADNAAYTWAFDYVPGGFALGPGQFNYGEITLTITPAGGGPSTTLRNALNPLQNRTNRVLNAFGFATFNTDDSDSTAFNTYFIDNLVYTIPEPSALALLVGAGLLLRRRRNS